MKYYAVLDVGGSSIKNALMNQDGEVIHSGASVTTPLDDLNAFVDTVAAILNGYKEYGKPLEGAAISMPCPINPKTGKTAGTGAVMCLLDGDAHAMLEEATGLKIIMENDGNCAGLAEGFLGNAKDVSNYVVIVIGTGVGGTIVINNQVVYGKNLHAGEFGCMTIENIFEKPMGTLLGDVGSTGRLVEAVARAKGIPSHELDGLKVFELYDNGDKIAIECVNKFYRYLAVTIFNLQYSIDPDKILIGGAISGRQELFSSVNKILAGMKGPYNILDITIEPCLFKGDANLIGALYQFIQKSKS